MGEEDKAIKGISEEWRCLQKYLRAIRRTECGGDRLKVAKKQNKNRKWANCFRTNYMYLSAWWSVDCPCSISSHCGMSFDGWGGWEVNFPIQKWDLFGKQQKRRRRSRKHSSAMCSPFSKEEILIVPSASGKRWRIQRTWACHSFSAGNTAAWEQIKQLDVLPPWWYPGTSDPLPSQVSPHPNFLAQVCPASFFQ